MDTSKEVYISYAKSGESDQLVNLMEKELQARGVKVIRDKYQLGNFVSITKFLELSGKNAAVIVMLSDTYLRSQHSMSELQEMPFKDHIRDRIFPVVLADANIYDAAQRILYIKFWEEKKNTISQGMESVSPDALQTYGDELNLYDGIQRTISSLPEILQGMNTLTPDMHQGNNFSELYTGIEKSLGIDAPQNQQQSNSGYEPATKTQSTEAEIEKPNKQALKAPQVGEKIGRYKILSELGRGGMSTVYRAYDPQFEREVAIKVLPHELLQADPQFRIRFEQEAKIIARLEHPNIVPVYDVGEEAGQPYFVMRLMSGGPLNFRIKSGIFTVEQAIKIIERVAPALDAAHALGIVHRDIKPSTILFDNNDEAFISDFGIAKIAQVSDGDYIIGTPAYMAPEQAQGENVDGRADIYALGIVLYEMLTGKQPYEADTPVKLIMKHITEPVPHILEVNPNLPQGIDQIIQKTTAKNRDDRYATAQALLDDLHRVDQLSESINIPESTVEKPAVEKIIELTPEQLQAAIAANLLNNNRSQAVFNDRAQGEDQLGIQDEVEALAETLLLRDVEPPVAVGIMGGWGSGKSFVMYMVNQYVQATRAKKIQKGWADKVENDPKIPSFVGHIYQVNFNAWTYAKSNLWASLMDTIFSTLNRQMQLERLLAHRDFPPEKGTPAKEQFIERMLAGGEVFKKIYADNPQFGQDKELEPWHANLKYWSHHLLKGTLLWNVMRGQQVETLDKLKNTEEQLHQLKARRDQFEKDPPKHTITPESLKKDETARQAYFQSIKSFMLAFLTEELSTVAAKELQKENVKEKDIQKYLEEAKGLAGGVNALRSGFHRHKIYRLWTIAFSILTVSLLYTWWSQDAAASVQLWLKPVISLFVTLLPALRIAIPWIKKSIDANVEAKKILEGAYATQQAKTAENIVNAPDKPVPQKIAELNVEMSRGSLPAYDTLINLLEAQAEEQRQKIGTTAKYSNLIEFVQSRLDAATYENQLGLMHQVRQDIDELTYSLVDNASTDFFPRGKPRVILYIDDLDRCPPPRVVEVLEAVQLLLSTKLFIVILGLDTRYVTRALEKEYKEILQHEGDPSGLDYIEKIIQIPYRVRAIDKDALRKYIEKQMDIEKSPEKETVAVEVPVTETIENPVAQIQTTPDQAVQTQSPETHAVEVKTPQNQQAESILDTPTQDQPVEGELQSQPSQVQRDDALHPQSQESLTEVDAVPSQATEAPSTPQVVIGEPPALSVQVQDNISVQDDAPQKDPAEVKLPEIELPAAVIQFKQEDLDDLAVCCHRVVLTPRSIKRLVNVFKLMKIFWFRADKNAGLAERDRPRRVKQAAMSLLALSSAYPEVMREVFVHLDTLYRQGREETELFTALTNIKLPSGSAHELFSQLQKYKADVNSFKSIAGNGQDKFGQLTLQELRASTFNVVRSFSFVGDPVYWTDGEEISAELSKAIK